MTAFFVCIILIGVMISVIAMIWMVLEKKKSRDYRLEIDERRYELQHAIEDAEMLLEELNHFSNYIVERMEEKQQEVEVAVRSADDRLDLLEQIKDIYIDQPCREMEMPLNSTEEALKREGLFEPAVSEPVKKAKIIHFDEKKREVIKLCKDGMNSTEIAKRMNMGKGEIELISRMCQ